MTHNMIDLETLDTKPSAAFITVGACQFDPDTGEIGKTFYKRVDWGGAMDGGRTVSPETLKWWLAQSDGAREEICKDGEPLQIVLDDLRGFLGRGAIVWGNGATFDISILEHAYKFKAPWQFWNVRDVRTIVDLSSHLVDKRTLKFQGTAHNALDDAVHQARYVSNMWQLLKKGSGQWPTTLK